MALKQSIPVKRTTGVKSTPDMRIAVLVDTSTTWGRDVIAGVHRYSVERGGWQLFVEPRGVEQRHRWIPEQWSGDGVIARIGYPELAEQLKTLRVPVVNVSGIELPKVKFPRVASDQKAAAEMAAQHLIERGFQNFAYFSLLGINYVAAHQKAFSRALARSGYSCSVFEALPHIGAEPDWNLDIDRIGQWLSSLPKPLAAFVWNTSSARELLYACAAAGLSVPLEVAVLSGSDDDLFCEVAPVPISAVRLPATTIGYRAASALDEMMRKPQSKAPSDVLISPLGVRVRQSTDTLAVDDPAMASALNFIRNNASRAINVEDVARHTGICRRTLEQKFRTLLGFSPATEIRRVRISRAVELLRLSNMPIGEVAQRAGFRSAEYMSAVFRSHLNASPSSYRENSFEAAEETIDQ